MTDLEIAKKAKLQNIGKIAEKLGINEDYLEQYGKYKAKISNKLLDDLADKKDGNLVLVTSINPTPLGEGKTTMAIGLSDGLNQIGKNSVLALREPSMGPVFGIKGGATGGGYAQVAPMEEINLHFTGDIHAITSANNLISAMIDNHIYFGNELGFKTVTWKRCVDLNDRQLRVVNTGLSHEKNVVPRMDGFDISVASEIMAVFCLAISLKDLRRRVGNIIIGYNNEDKPITVKDLKADGAVVVILKEAFNPNLVQTLENNPAIIHGGPFANIAHGCNSIMATKLALKLGDYVITEAGFGADLGAEKFLDIKCRVAGLNPKVAICVATLKALKYHGGSTVDECKLPNVDTLKVGIENLLHHVSNLQNVYGVKTIVAINKYESDTDEEIKVLEEALNEQGIEMSLCEVWGKGGKGAIDLAEKVVKAVDNSNRLTYAYELNQSIKDKIKSVAIKVYGAVDVEYTDEANEQIARIEKIGFDKLPVCIAKTQYSFSDDPKNLLCNEPFKIHIAEIMLRGGAEFIVARTGKIFTMPGLPRIPSAENIYLDDNDEIVGIF